MSLFNITRNAFQSVISRLGLINVGEPWTISNTVLPVSIVDTDLSLPVIPTTLIMNLPFTQGEIVSVGAGVLLADTGPLVGGNYNFLCIAGINSNAAGAGGDFRIQRRDAANATSVWTQTGGVGSGSNMTAFYQFSAFMNAGERLRFQSITAWTVGATGQVSIWSNPAT